MGVIYAFLLGIFEFFRGGKNSQYNQSPFGDNKESFLSYFYNLMSDFNFFSFFIVLFLCMFIGFMYKSIDFIGFPLIHIGFSYASICWDMPAYASIC